MAMKVLIPDSIVLSLPIIEGIEFIEYSVTTNDFTAVQDAELLVMWMNSPENTAAAVEQLINLKVVQTLAAGPDHVLSANFPSHIQIASGRGLHDKTVAEHALTLTLSLIRAIPTLLKSQSSHEWNFSIIEAQAAPSTSHLYTLNGANVLIYGFGSIASHLSPMLQALGANVTGVARNAAVKNGFKVISELNSNASLAEADVVISLLPYEKSTEKYFDKAFFQDMKKSAVFINVGRGKTVDEVALEDALRSQIIRSAAIDVTFDEPLSSDSNLWEIPELLITPHISGGRPQNSEDLIAFNSKALLNGDAIRNQVAR